MKRPDDRAAPTHLKCSRCGHVAEREQFHHRHRLRCPECGAVTNFFVVWSHPDGSLRIQACLTRGSRGGA